MIMKLSPHSTNPAISMSVQPAHGSHAFTIAGLLREDDGAEAKRGQAVKGWREGSAGCDDTGYSGPAFSRQ